MVWNRAQVLRWGASVVLRPLPLALAPVAPSAAVGRTAELLPEPVIPPKLSLSEVDLSRTDTVKLEAEPAVDSAVEALRQAKVQLAQAPEGASPLEFLDAQRTYVATEVEYIQEPSAHWNAVFQIQAATAMELIQ
jgi:hypothetical protein